MFSKLFINAVMTAHAPSIAEYLCVAISNNFALGSSITQYVSTNSKIDLNFELAGRNV